MLMPSKDWSRVSSILDSFNTKLHQITMRLDRSLRARTPSTWTKKRCETVELEWTRRRAKATIRAICCQILLVTWYPLRRARQDSIRLKTRFRTPALLNSNSSNSNNNNRRASSMLGARTKSIGRASGLVSTPSLPLANSKTLLQ